MKNGNIIQHQQSLLNNSWSLLGLKEPLPYYSRVDVFSDIVDGSSYATNGILNVKECKYFTVNSLTLNSYLLDTGDTYISYTSLASFVRLTFTNCRLMSQPNFFYDETYTTYNKPLILTISTGYYSQSTYQSFYNNLVFGYGTTVNWKTMSDWNGNITATLHICFTLEGFYFI